MQRSLILKEPLFEDANLFSLESLLGRCVSNMDVPTDDFEPDLDVSLGDCLEKYTMAPPKISFSQYLKASSDEVMRVKITDLFSAAQKAHYGSEVDVETAELKSLDLIRHRQVLGDLWEYGKWRDSATRLFKRKITPVKIAYWIVGITIVTGGKIKNARQIKSEKNKESTLPLGKAAAAAAALHGVPPNLVPLDSLDLQGNVAKATEVESHGEIEATGRCLFSIRYARIIMDKRGMVYQNAVPYRVKNHWEFDESARNARNFIIGQGSGQLNHSQQNEVENRQTIEAKESDIQLYDYADEDMIRDGRLFISHLSPYNRTI